MNINERKNIKLGKNLLESVFRTDLSFKESYNGISKWKIKNLGEVCQIVMGQSPSSLTYNNKGEGLPLIQGNADIVNRKSIIRFYTSEPTKKCKIGDIIMTVRAPVGSIALAEHDSCIGRGVCAIANANTYIYQYLISCENKWVKYSQGSTFTAISSKEVRTLKIPIPPLKEQQKIADILTTWDKAIELKEKFVEEKKKKKTGFMQRLLNGVVRLKGFNGKWEKTELGKFLIKYTEKTIKNNQYPVLTSSRKGIFLQKDYFAGNDVASKNNIGYNIVPRNYFTYRHMSDDIIFKFNINDIVDKGIVSTLYPVFTTNKNLDSDFLKILLNRGNEFKKYALEQKQGGSRTYMYYSKLEKLVVKLPPKEEQLAISKIEKIADKEIELLTEELEALKVQKKGLMQLLLTGIVRVNNDNKQ